MNTDDVIDLLSMIAAYDQRTIGEGDVHAWLIVASEEHWTMPLARRAVIEHHRRGGDRPRIRPAHITDAILTVEETIRTTVLRCDLTPPRELADDVDAEIAWRRAYTEQAKRRALTAWANGDTMPQIDPAPALQPDLHPDLQPAHRQLVDAKGDAVPTLQAIADARAVPAQARREPADPNQRAAERERARAELDVVRANRGGDPA